MNRNFGRFQDFGRLPPNMDNGGLDRTLFDTDAPLWKLQGALLPPKRDKQELTSVIVPRSKKPDMCPLGRLI